MAGVETGPLTLGEILDRMFSIYRKNFLMLVGIAGLPYAGVTVIIGFLIGLAALIGTRGVPESARVGVPAAAGGIFLIVVIVDGFGDLAVIGDYPGESGNFCGGMGHSSRTQADGHSFVHIALPGITCRRGHRWRQFLPGSRMIKWIFASDYSWNYRVNCAIAGESW